MSSARGPVGRDGWLRVGAVPGACLALGAAAVVVARATARPARAPGGPGRAALEPCVVWALREVGRCGTVTVFEDRDRRAGRTIRLRVVVLPARGPRGRGARPFGGDSLGEPVVFLTGGPGAGSVDGARYAADALAPLRARHALVLVDQRGTGRSAPLDCDLAGNALQPHVDPWFAVAPVRRCRGRLARRADLTQYTTARAADDLAEVLDALGVARASLFGVSYGGRLALAFLRRHPERVRAVVAQSAPPPERVVPLAAGWAGARALAARAAECAADSACSRAAPHPLGDLRAVADRLAARPAPRADEGGAVTQHTPCLASWTVRPLLANASARR